MIARTCTIGHKHEMHIWTAETWQEGIVTFQCPGKK